MSTYRELVYMILDEVKLLSDDSYYTEDHVIYLINKYRAQLLEKKYAQQKDNIPESNYQTITLNLELITTPLDACNEEAKHLRSIEELPILLPVGKTSVYASDYYQSAIITYITRDRMKYTGYNKFLKNILYCSMHPDRHLYFKTVNEDYLELKKVYVTGLFEDPTALLDGDEDALDAIVPIEEALLPMIINSVLRELLGAAYRPKDPDNNAKDDLSNIMTFIRSNMKNNLQKQLEGTADNE